MSSGAFDFQVTHREGLARRGELRTPHGVIQTPVFMPVGTRGAVKAVTHRQLAELGAEIILGNTYHLFLRPGAGLIARAGGLHRFIGWDRPILTDSGGYQVFSLAALRELTEEGVAFRSHLDGTSYLLTPERSMQVQMNLGADLVMAFDECPPWPAPREAVAEATDRTTRWAQRSRAAHTRSDQWLFGIVQGGVHADLREKSARELIALQFLSRVVGRLGGTTIRFRTPRPGPRRRGASLAGTPRIDPNADSA